MTDTKQTITIKEFKMWLSGVEEMQDDGWIPSPAQWAKIREKIDTIDDTPKAHTVPAGPVARAAPETVTYAAPALSGAPSARHAPQAMPQVMPQAPNNPLFGPGGGRAKTPDIDTSSGQYDSTFV